MVGDTEVGRAGLCCCSDTVRACPAGASVTARKVAWEASDSKAVQAERLPLLKGDGGEATCVDANRGHRCVCVCVYVSLSPVHGESITL